MKPIVVVGGGGHAKVVIDAARAAGHEVVGFVTRTAPEGRMLLGAPWLGDDESLSGLFAPRDFYLAHGVGSVRAGTLRREIFERLQERGYTFASIVHPRSVVAEDTSIGEGAVIMAAAVLQPGVVLEANVIVNTSASVDHDSVIGAHTHIAPGVRISGNVHIGEGTLVGAGAVVLQGRRIGAGCVIGAGAVVIHDVGAGERVLGVPAARNI